MEMLRPLAISSATALGLITPLAEFTPPIADAARVEIAAPTPEYGDADPCVHEVVAGEGYWRIATNAGLKFIDFMAENKLTETSVPHPGDKVDICIGTTPATQTTTTAPASPESGSCPTKVTKAAEISATCKSNAAALIKAAGYYNLQAYQQANGLGYWQQSSNLGVYTYNKAMSGANLTVTSKDMREHLEVNLAQQIARFFVNGKAVAIARISSGTEQEYQYTDKKGVTHTATAHTPIGTFTIFAAMGADYRSSELGGPVGSMAYALKLTTSKEGNSIAVHSGKVSKYPSSHGCIRVDLGNPADQTDDAILDMIEEGLNIGDLVMIS